MAVGILILVLIIIGLLWLLLQRSLGPKISRDYKIVFEYYDLGYADQKAGRPESDWSKILESKVGEEKTKFEREIKAYKLGYDEAQRGEPKRTEQTIKTSAEAEQLWEEFSEYVK